MTEYTTTLHSLRVAHGEFVGSVLAVARVSDPTLMVQHLVAHNRWVAAQLREIYQRPTTVPPATASATSDVASLLADLAASCAEVGAVVRSLPTRAQECGTALLWAVIGQYSEQTARLRGCLTQ